MRGNVRERSRAAVAKAGTRDKRRPVESAGTWTETRGKRADGPWRPGKSKLKRRGGAS